MIRCALVVGALLVAATASCAVAQVLNTYEKPFVFTYGDFGKSSVADGVAHVVGSHGRSGAGHTGEMDMSAYAHQTPVLHVKLGPGNKATHVRLVLDDAGKHKRVFEYDLSGADTSRFTAIYPRYGLPLSPKALGEPDTSFDPARITAHHIQGDWKDHAVDIYIDRIEVASVPPEAAADAAEHIKQLQTIAAREQAKAAKEQARREEMLSGRTPHAADGPQVLRIAPVAQDVLGIYIREGVYTPAQQVPYTPQDGDRIEIDDKHKALAWQDGEPGWRGRRKLIRKGGGGILVVHDRVLSIDAFVSGQRLERATVDLPAAYRVVSDDDPQFAQPLMPLAVYRKSVPRSASSTGPVVDHAIYLKLPHALKSGATYRIDFVALNTAVEHATFTHQPTTQRTEALHVSHIGFRPNDPVKRAFLSTWLGSGGATAYAQPQFELLDAVTHQRVHTGTVTRVLAEDGTETLAGKTNRAGTNVYRLDFNDFSSPGLYVVHLPGVGVSYPFPIDDDVWRTPLQTSMHGLLVHRSGIALGEPFSDYHRPRTMHPADGLRVFQLDRTTLEGESDSVRDALTRLIGPDMNVSQLEHLPQAWGGYMDAGDWDRRSKHLDVSLMLAEAFDLYPERLASFSLALPPDEANNGIPDILDEILWNVDFYHRMQREDGGVRGGIESTSHPRAGETSWQESLLVGAFDVDPISTLRFAAAAARTARLLKPYDKHRADQLRTSAIRAWQWTEQHGSAADAAIAQRNPKAADNARKSLPGLQALAAIELYRLTADRAYQDAFVSASVLTTGGDRGTQLDSIFAYAMLDGAAVDADLQAKARQAIVQQADASLAMQQGNAFGITMRVGLPLMGWVGYYTTPETTVGPVVTRAYVLTGDRKYLAGAIAAAQYTLGANPMNITMTTGLGHDFPRAVLHVDSRAIGVAAPRGITLYGNTDPQRAPPWVKQWILGPYLHPAAKHWPASEFYVDSGNWPEMNEYTVHQSIGPTAYYWACLYAMTP